MLVGVLRVGVLLWLWLLSVGGGVACRGVVVVVECWWGCCM